MAYAGVSDLRLRLGEAVFAELYPAGIAASDDLASAAAEIDGVLGSRYAVPVTAPGALELLKDWNLTLAEERAYARSAGAAFSDKIKERVAQVRKYLEMVAADRFLLSGCTAGNSGGLPDYIVVAADEPNFTREKMGGY